MFLESRKINHHGWHYFSEIVRNKKCGSHKCQMLAPADSNFVAFSFVTWFSSDLINYFYTIHTDHIFNRILTRRAGIFSRTLPHDWSVADKHCQPYIFKNESGADESYFCKMFVIQLRALGLLLADGAPSVGRGKNFDASNKFLGKKTIFGQKATFRPNVKTAVSP